MFEVIMKELGEDGDYRTECKVVHNGETLFDECDGGEPEDNYFFRDWSWVPAAIEKAYECGVKDGKEGKQ